jgi:hypothetical protein
MHFLVLLVFASLLSLSLANLKPHETICHVTGDKIASFLSPEDIHHAQQVCPLWNNVIQHNLKRPDCILFLFEKELENDVERSLHLNELLCNLDMPRDDDTFLIVAAHHGHLNAVRELIALNDSGIHSAALEAATQGHNHLIQFFLSTYPDRIDQRNILYLMCGQGQTTTVLDILASYPFTHRHRREALYTAILNNRLNTADAILNTRGRFDFADGKLLALAVQKNLTDLVRRMLVKGATAVGTNPIRAVESAIQSNNVGMVNLLLQFWKGDRETLEAAIYMENPQVVKLLLGRGIQPSFRELENGMTSNNKEIRDALQPLLNVHLNVFPG